MIKKMLGIACFLYSTMAFADVSVTMYSTADQSKQNIGTIQIKETKYGLLFTPHLNSLPPGIHGFHIHQSQTCANNGMAAGEHFDPKGTHKHLGPYDDQGHLGDLPPLYVDSAGNATQPVLAPRIKHLSEIEHRSLMIHAGGDNFSDTPEKSGGGGKRLGCGVIE